jgi:hypothetical protein
MNAHRLAGTVLLCALGALACGDRDEALERRIDWLGSPLALGDRVLLVDKATPRAFLVDVGEDAFGDAPTVSKLPHDPRAVFARNGADEALVLCMGRRASAQHDPEPAALAVVEADGDVRAYAVGTNPFDSLAQSEDGRYAFLFKRGSAERLLDNPNEVAIVDLEASPRNAVTLRTLVSFGDSPLAVAFSPTMRIVGEERRLAIVLSETNVTLLDLDHLDRVETTVQLGGADGPKVSPVQVLFNPEAPEIYVRGRSSEDVFVFNLAPRPEGGPDDGLAHNDFRPFIDQLGIGGGPTDMALYEANGGTRLLVLAARQAAVVDPSTSQVTSVSLPQTADRALIFSATSPRDREIAQRALLYREDGGSSLTFLDLEGLEERGSRNLEVLPLTAPIAKLIPMLEEQRVLIIHEAHSASLIDLAGRTVSPITSSAQLQNALFDAERRTLWVGPPGQRYVGLLELDTGDTPEVLLDANVASLVPMFEAGHVVVLHDSTVGHLTVLDARNPTRETARSLRGFVIADLLDRGE